MAQVYVRSMQGIIGYAPAAMASPRSRRLGIVALGVLLCVEFGLSLDWQARDHEQLYWDSSDHAGRTLKVRHALWRTEPPLRGSLLPEPLLEFALAHPTLARLVATPVAGFANLVEAIYRGPVRPPLAYWPAGILLGVVEPSPDAIALTHGLFWFLVLIAGSYHLAAQSIGPSAGVLAALLTASTPMLLGQSHLPMLDVPLAALTVWGLWALIESDGFRDRRASLLFGALCGAGMLVKQSFAVVVAAPLLWELALLVRARAEVGVGWLQRVRRIQPAGVREVQRGQRGQEIQRDQRIQRSQRGQQIQRGQRGQRIRRAHAIQALLAALLVAGPWYAIYLPSTLRFIAFSASQAGVEGDPASLSLEGLLFYPDSLVRLSLGPILTAASILALAVMLLARHGRERRPILLALASIFAVFGLLHPNKDPRYLVPALPLLCVAIAAAVARIQFRWVRRALGAALAGTTAIATWQLQFSEPAERWPPIPPTNWVTWAAFGPPSAYAFPPRSREWHYPRILDAIREDRRTRSRDGLRDSQDVATLFVVEDAPHYADHLSVLTYPEWLQARDGVPVPALSVVREQRGAPTVESFYVLLVSQHTGWRPLAARSGLDDNRLRRVLHLGELPDETNATLFHYSRGERTAR